MTASVHERLTLDPTEVCAVEFLTKHSTAEVAYMCGKCLLIGARGTDGFVYTDEGSCEVLSLDGLEHDLEA